MQLGSLKGRPTLVAIVFVACVGFAPGARGKPVVATAFLQSDVALPPDIVARARTNHELFVRARASEADSCAFVADTISLYTPLRNAVFAVKPPASFPGTSGDTYGATADGAYATMATELGIGGVRWDKVMSVASPLDRPLLEAARDLDGENNWGVWEDPNADSDFGGCHKPERAMIPLAHLVRPWRETSTCMRAVLKPYLVARLTEMAEDTCLCGGENDRASLARRLAANARILDELRDIGPPIARKLRAMMSRSDLHLPCHRG